MGKLKEKLHEWRREIASELCDLEVKYSKQLKDWMLYKQLRSELAKIDAILLEYENLGEEADD